MPEPLPSPTSGSSGPPPFGTLLFDLDGTLLDIHMPTFLQAYFPLLAPFFSAFDSVDALKERLMTAVRMMLHNRDESLLLSRVFLDSFAPSAGMSAEAARSALLEFHNGEFEKLRPLARPIPGARPLLEKALDLGCELVLATNPVFFPEAIEARVSWAGIEDIPFSFVSTAENMHFCKPYPEYFTEILDHLGRAPEACMMIGNDPAKDIPAGRVGITTFFIPSADEKRRTEDADFAGTLEDLSRLLDKMGPVTRNDGPPGTA